MIKKLFFTLLIAFTISNLFSQGIIISEVVDGTASGGYPKYVELTNTTTTDFDLNGYKILKSGSSGFGNGYTFSSTYLLPAGASIVITNLSSASLWANHTLSIPTHAVYGATSVNGNGDDAYAFTDASESVIDIFGVESVDGSGSAWEYENSYAYRNATTLSPNTTFTATEWTVLPKNTLNNQASDLSSYLTPGTHTFSAPVADIIAPIIDSVATTSATNITVYFNETLDATTAETIANYTGITGISTATLSINLMEVEIFLTTALTSAQSYNLTINNVKDAALNIMDSSQTFAVMYTAPAPDTQAPIVSSATATSGTSILVIFNEELNYATSKNIANYTGITGISSATLSANFMEVELLLNAALTSAQAYNLTIDNVKDSALNIMTSAQTFPIMYTADPAQSIIISEVADGTVSSTPKYVELTNTGTTDFDLNGYKIQRSSNGNPFAFAYTFTSTQILPAGASIVVCNLSSATLWSNFSLNTPTHAIYNANIYGNGNDAYAFTSSADVIIDIYGAEEDGAGKTWEYTDSYAHRNSSVSSANSTFNDSEWTIASPNTLDGISDYSTHLTPGTFGPFVPTADITAPIVLSVATTSDTTITVVFNENLNSATSENIANYTGITDINTATLSVNFMEVELHVNTALTSTLSYNLTINNVKDSALNVMDSAQTFAVMYTAPVADTQAPIVLSAATTSDSTILVVFNEELNYATSIDIANYTGIPDINTATLSANFMEVELHVNTALTSAQSYNLTINNVKDSALNIMDSAQTFAVMYTAPFIPDLVITEIMYRSQSGADNKEFIEIYNNETVAVNLNGYSFSYGISFTFPNVDIAAGEYILLAGDTTTFNSFFDVKAYKWSGSLSNGGESIVLITDQGDVVDSVKYDDGNGWPSKANAGGSSLTLCNADDDNSIVANWSAAINFVGLLANNDSIFANPGMGCFTPVPPTDTDAPIVNSATATSDTTILVVFNEELNYATSKDIANYTGITGINTAILSVNFMEVELHVTNALTSAQSYNLTINNVKDSALNVMDSAQTFAVMYTAPITDTQAPIVDTAYTTSDTTIMVVFNEELNSATSEDIANYTGITGINTATLSVNFMEVELHLTTALTPAQSYNLTINNVKDSALNIMDSAQTFAVMHTAPVIPNHQSIIISEIVGRSPSPSLKYVELTNKGAIDFDLDGYKIRRSSNGANFSNAYTFSGTQVLPAGATIVVSNLSSASSWSSFNLSTPTHAIYGAGIYGNGNDAYAFTTSADVVIDVYGTEVDGLGTAWEYTNSYASRITSITNANSTFTQSEWTIAVLNTLDGQAVDFSTYLTPGTHGPIIDIIAPLVSTANATSDTTISVVFNEVLDIATAETIANYTGLTGLNVATLSANLMEVELDLNTALVSAQSYNLTINNVKDTALNVMDSSQTFAVMYTAPITDTQAPIVDTAYTSSDTTILVVFNEELNSATSEDIANYTGITDINTATLSANFMEVELHVTTALTSAQSYNLTINNVKDSALNVMDSAQTFVVMYTAPAPNIIPNIVITEIMYKSEGGSSDKKEFIEIYNNDTVIVNLNGYKFTQGIVYTFPNININVNDYLVISIDSAIVNSFYSINSLEWTSGSLKNGGEDIILETDLGDIIDIVDYDDGSGWPTINGNSITLCNANDDNSLAINWSAAINFVDTNAAGASIWANPGMACFTPVTPPDTNAPIVLNATATSDTTISVVFNELLDITTAEAIANYTGITGLNTATLSSDMMEVELDLNTTLVSAQSYNLTINTVKDTALNVMDSAQTFAVMYTTPITDTQAPIVDTAYTTSDTTIMVVFNEELNSATSENIANYTGITGINTATLSVNFMEVELHLTTALTSAQSYNLTINNVKDSALNVMDSAQTFTVMYTTPIPVVYPDIIISEVVDGTGSGGYPKFVELTNTSSSAIDLNGYKIRRSSNGTGFSDAYIFTSTQILPAGASIVVTNMDNITSGQIWADFNLIAPTHAIYGAIIYGNGDDAYGFTDSLDFVIDIYGEELVDGTGKTWEYYDSYAYRNNGIITPRSTFNQAEWTTAPINTLDYIFSDLSPYLTPGTHGPITDTLAPIVSTATATSDTTITIVFNELLDITTAEAIANYTGLTGVNTATLSANLMEVELDLNTALVSAQSYNLTINNVKDTAMNIMDSAQVFVVMYISDTIAPIVSSATATSDTTINIVFNETVEITSAETIANYTGITGIATATLSTDFMEVELKLSTALISAQSYNITIDDVKDVSMNMMDSSQTFAVMYTASIIPDIVITEIMYNGPESNTDTTEFIEIYNNGSTTIDLTGYSFSQGVNYTFPSMSINAGEYLAICYNNSKFQHTYGFTTIQWQSGGLGNGGEIIKLIDASGTIIDIVDYDDGGLWPSHPDGSGSSLTLCDPSLDNNIGSSWSYATTFVTTNAAGDSIWANPGYSCAGPAVLPDTLSPIVYSASTTSDTTITVVFNEVLDITTAEAIANYTGITGINTATLSSNMMEVELDLNTALVSAQSYNLTINNVKDTALNMMDSAQTFAVIYTAPIADIIAPIVNSATATSDLTINVAFTEALDNTSAEDITNYTGITGITAATLNANMMEVELSLTTALVSAQSYNITIDNVKDLAMNVMDSSQTFAIIYTTPPPYFVPNLVITEIMYNGPESGTDTTEFIEIYNNDTVAVNMNGYSFSQGVTYTFPNVSIDSGEYIIVAYDSAMFYSFFGVSAYEWTTGGLSNGGEDIILITDQGDTVDVVDYDDAGLWPTTPDGGGQSLTLCDPDDDNNIGSNWSAAINYVDINAVGDSIWANPGTGCFTPITPVDTIAPIVSSANATTTTSITVIFNEVLDNTTAEAIANYTGITGLSTATLSTNMMEVELSLTTPLIIAQSYNLTINNVKDTAMNIMDSAQVFAIMYNIPVGDTIAPIANSATVISANSILVIYSEPVLATSAENTANYTGLGSISSATLNNGNAVTLTLANNLTLGISNTLTIDNVKDTALNAMENPQNFDLIFNNSIATIVISEIMYNDLSSSDSLEYFEIYNNDNTAANISGYSVTDGISYTFPENTILAAGEYLVIAKEASLVNSVFSITGTHEWTSGGLKNSGEAIQIENTNGDIIDVVNYSDASPWPTQADGDGPSLELCDKNTDNDNGINWSLGEKFAGTFMGDSIFGTPGEGCFVDAINNNNGENNLVIDIYPNPANDILNIRTTAKSLQIEIYNVQGSLQISETISNNQQKININNLSKGVYFVRVIDNRTGNYNTKKLIVQ